LLLLLLILAASVVEKMLRAVVLSTVVGTGAVIGLTTRRAYADSALAPPKYPWQHNSMFKGLDMKRYAPLSLSLSLLLVLCIVCCVPVLCVVV
jgi:hypothetical protein